MCTPLTLGRRDAYSSIVTSTAVLSELAWLLSARRTLVLTGAGISTDSGIPDYRGPRGSLKKRSPISFSQFMRDPGARQRYWARSAIGWPIVSSVNPNPSHLAVANLEAAGIATGVVTQNVDGLHQRAGSRRVVELHGRLSRVVCLDCGNYEGREALQQRMLRDNPRWNQWQVEEAPDGDAELPEELTREFAVPVCNRCGGTLKPDVVFFGENVPAARVEDVYAWVSEAEALLVLGSSLKVYSGFRFVERAYRLGKPVAIVNLGETRADHIASLRINEPLSAVMTKLQQGLGIPLLSTSVEEEDS